MSNIRLNEDMIGKKVRCIDKLDCYYPEPGTIGTIVRYDNNDAISSYKVQWPKGSTKEDDEWWALNNYIELVEDDMTINQKIPDMTNEEIWEMLRPKMEKNNLLSKNFSVGQWGYITAYDCIDVERMVAIAYRSGYERAMKGRPFKIGEKKKKGGHWEPVDPVNLPKEGTKIKYSRCIDDIEVFSDWTGIQIGEETTVDRSNCGEFWVKDIHNVNNGYPLCSHRHPERFDMWVEDEE